jgi:threonine/homoserine/homoserine lactone efflux protein
VDTGLIPFLGGVAFISLSGVMTPGPLLAVTVARGRRHRHAGAWISLGHGLVELPLVLLIWLGLGSLFVLPAWKMGVGLLGGAALILMGVGVYRARGETLAAEGEPGSSTSLAAGLAMTLANPYVFIWWATIGAALVTKAARWGPAGMGAFFLVHWSCDLGWNVFISRAAHRAGRFWPEIFQRRFFAACGVFLVLFGLWFLFDAVR